MITNLKAFKARQKRMIDAQSKERKEAEKKRQEEWERDYWLYMNDQSDRTPEDYQGYDEEEKEN